MQQARGFIVGCATGWLWSPGRQSTPNSKLGKLFIDKKPYYQHVTYKLQSDWLHACKAILLVQISRATCLQSNSIGTNGAGFLLGVGNPTISRETETQVPAACQPQPRQPRIIKLISQLQKPTRKISDTWIIDTGKRETRYRLVKIYQTILQPHIIICIYEVVAFSPGKLDSSLWFIQPRLSHDVLCI